MEKQLERSRNISHLIAAIVSLSSLGFVMQSYSPAFATIPAFYILLTSTVFFFTLFFSHRIYLSIAITILIFGILLLRQFGFRTYWYTLIYILLIVTSYYTFIKR